jgi:large subunit ribosomal protein L4e
MKAQIMNIEGRKTGEIELPRIFSEKIREDIVAKVLEAKKTKQPYGPSLVAGRQHSAAGKTVHRRHVWRSGYGRGMSRIPRKIFSEKGSLFNWAGAEVPFARGGRRAHPPKSLFMINTKKINKKEAQIASVSAFSATASKKHLFSKYRNLKENEIPDLPVIVESRLASLKSTKELESSLKKILGENLFGVVSKKKKTRSGKGKFRGRRHKTNAGPLIVIGSNEKIKTKNFEIKKISNLSIDNLARGGLGRLVIYTENAIKELGEKLK